jgi:hypothetical protein
MFSSTLTRHEATQARIFSWTKPSGTGLTAWDGFGRNSLIFTGKYLPAGEPCMLMWDKGNFLGLLTSGRCAIVSSAIFINNLVDTPSLPFSKQQEKRTKYLVTNASTMTVNTNHVLM